MGTPAEGALAKFAVDSALPFDTSSKAFEIQYPETLKRTDTIRRSEGMRGDRSRSSERRRLEQQRVGGSVSFHPGPAELDFFLQYILGGTPTAGVTALAATVPAFYAMVDRVTKVFTYNLLKVARARLSGSSGSPVALTLDLEGQSEDVDNAGTFPAITIPAEAQYIFPHATVTLDGTEYEMNRFELLIDNFLDGNRFMNSTTRSKIPEQDRLVQLSLGLAYTADEQALHATSLAGFAGSLVLDDETTSYTFAFANLHAPTDTPTVQGKSEILFPLTYTSERTAATRELIVTKA